MIRREVQIGEQRVRFWGDERAVIIYGIAPIDGDQPVYIGSTSQLLHTRIRGHVLDAKAGSPLPVHKWIRSQTGFDVCVIERCAEALRVERERYWVAQYASHLNVTDGGPGASGTSWTETRRHIVSAAMRSGDTFTCQQCGTEFWRKRRDILKGHNKYCSRECYQTSLRGKTRPIPEHVRQRGVEAAAKRRRGRTHCTHGHELTAENMRVNKNGARVCRVCERRHKRPLSGVAA